MILVDCCQTNKSIINFTTEDMTSKIEFFSKKKVNDLYLTKSILTDWLQMLDDNWDEKDTSYLDDPDLWLDWFYKYFNEILLHEDIKSYHHM